MAASRVAPAKKSRGKPMKKDTPGRPPHAQGRPARAQRDDTPEANQQRRRAPKTHPTRTPGARRKDKTRER